MKYLMLILFIASAYGDVIDNRQYSIRYFAGEFLIYDCLDKHWVCADEDSNQKCLRKRKQDMLEEKPILSCIAVKQFESVKHCLVRKQYMVNNPVDDLLCQHPERLKKPFISL